MMRSPSFSSFSSMRHRRCRRFIDIAIASANIVAIDIGIAVGANDREGRAGAEREDDDTEKEERPGGGEVPRWRAALASSAVGAGGGVGAHGAAGFSGCCCRSRLCSVLRSIVLVLSTATRRNAEWDITAALTAPSSVMFSSGRLARRIDRSCLPAAKENCRLISGGFDSTAFEN
mmetsp:Transcript_24926/g.53956  ORF Transcript_24926/g.53956 Transcript_24926/m.53956 type:complete len:175 (-) Transcript_24926:199-723(-)